MALYTRLSSDRDGNQTATARQEQACRAFAASRGWEIVDVFEDVDLSAFKPNVTRPAYETLLASVRGRAVDGVLVWKLDRLVRRPVEFERFWAACEVSGVFLASVTEPIDSSTQIGLAIVRVLVTFASLESSTIGLRITARLRQKAELGLAPSIRRPLGHSTDWKELVPEEVALIREAARRVIAGEPMKAIARSWQDRGLRRHTGGPWTGERVGELLRSRRLVGDRTFKGEVVATDCFPAILDRPTWAQVQVALARRTAKPNPASPYLLSGLLVCGRCGGRMYGRRTHPHSYACSSVPGCGHNAVGGTWVEHWVTQHVLHRLRHRNESRSRRRNDSEVIAAHAQRLRDLAHDYFMGALTDRQTYLEARAALRRANEGVSGWAPSSVGPAAGLNPSAAPVAWDVLTLPQRRAVIAAELDHVVVGPANGSRRDPSRLRPQWARPEPVGLPPFDWQPPTTAAPLRDAWLSETEAIRHAGFSRTALRRALRRGELSYETHRGRVRIRRSSLDRLLDEHRVNRRHSALAATTVPVQP